jgi:hypothetical protein
MTAVVVDEFVTLDESCCCFWRPFLSSVVLLLLLLLHQQPPDDSKKEKLSAVSTAPYVVQRDLRVTIRI